MVPTSKEARECPQDKGDSPTERTFSVRGASPSCYARGADRPTPRGSRVAIAEFHPTRVGFQAVASVEGFSDTLLTIELAFGVLSDGLPTGRRTAVFARVGFAPNTHGLRTGGCRGLLRVTGPLLRIGRRAHRRRRDECLSRWRGRD